MPLLPLATQSRPAEYAGERLLNYSWDAVEGALIGRSGLVPAHTLSGTVRAMGEMGGKQYAVAGGWLWDVAAETQIGQITDDASTTMAEMANNLCIVAGGKYYVYDGALLQQYDTGQVTTPTSVATMDGYVLVAGQDATRADRIAVSRLDAPTVFDGLDFATAETLPDGIVRVIRDHKEVVAVGARSIERFYNSGNTFPFAANASGFAERGCQNGRTVALSDNGLYWLGDDGLVYRSFGGTPEIISTPSISAHIATKTVDRAIALEDRGRKFYVLRFTDAPAVAFSIGSGSWSEFSTGAAHGAWMATAAYRFNGVQYVGTNTGKVCTLSGWEDDGMVVRAEVYAQPVRERVVSVGNLVVQMDTGLGDIGRDRLLNLQISRDGKNWTASRPRDLGTQGEYMRSARWFGLGTYQNFFQARLWMTDPVQRDIHGAFYG